MKHFLLYVATLVAVLLPLSMEAQDITTLPWVKKGQECTKAFNQNTGTVFGTDAGGTNISYVDLSNYGKLILQGDANQDCRLFINREEFGDAKGTITVHLDGTGQCEYDFNNLLDSQPLLQYIHLNGIKSISWDKTITITSATVGGSAITFPTLFETPAGETNITSLTFNGTCDNNIGVTVGTAAVVYGNQSDGNNYVDVTEYGSLKLYGTPGVKVRVFVNRVGTGGTNEQLITINSNGVGEMSITNVMSNLGADHCYISCLKTDYSSVEGKVNGITLTEKSTTPPDVDPDPTTPISTANMRRPIDNKHPLWMVHIDIWNNADPQTVIDLIPDDIKPYVVMNLSLSCAYDTKKNVHTRPQNGIATYRSWASVCCANNMWFTCQPASGGHTHIQDDAVHFDTSLELMESFFKDYPNFLGWNYAEQFWGFGEPGDAFSSKEDDRLKLFAKLVPIHHKYGGFLTISYTGSIWHQNLNPVAMLKRNAELKKACEDYPEACIWMYKYTHSACFYNNESTCISPFISGLAANYGVRYDNCGYTDAILAKSGENSGYTYPNAVGFGTVMEQTCINGGAVWDGPELIWNAECFIGDNDKTDSEGYKVRALKRSPSLNNGWIDMFRKIIDGTLDIPTREEVVEATKVAIVNDNNETTPPYGFYKGVYWQDDPLNNIAGKPEGDNYKWYLKSTGRYRAVPYLLSGKVPSSIKVAKKHSELSSWSSKTNDFNAQYDEQSTGDLFVSRRNNLLVTYFPYSYYNEKTTASAEIPLKYNTCTSLGLNYSRFGNGTIQEYADHIDLYLNNYCEHDRSGKGNNPQLVTDVITINGATSKPTYVSTNRTSATDGGSNSCSESWADGVYTLSVTHNGAVDIRINCQGSATGRLTASSRTPLSASDIKQPDMSNYRGPLVIEAEDMWTKSAKHVVLLPYFSGGVSEWYPEVKGHTGLGFVNMGNAGASLKNKVALKMTGSHTIGIRYTADKGAARLNVKINGETREVKLPKTNYNEWNTVEIVADLYEGNNTIYYNNADATEFYIDNVTYQFNYENGDYVTTTDTFTAYELNMNNVDDGKFPAGWRSVSGDNNEVHEYNNSYESGPRTFTGFNPAVLYWRQGTLTYGEQENYRLHLMPGTYTAEFVNFAWKNTPNYTFGIYTSNGDEVDVSGTLTTEANPNGEGAKGTNAYPSSQSFTFTIRKEGDYVAKFATSGFNEHLLASFKITGTVKTTTVENVTPPTTLSALPGTMHPLSKADFKNWEDEHSDWSTVRLGKSLGNGALIYGDEQHSYQNYLDVSSYSSMTIKGTEGAQLQLYFDQQWDSTNKKNTTYTLREATIQSNGSVSVDLSALSHLNCIKFAPASSGKVTDIRFYSGSLAEATKNLGSYSFDTYDKPDGTKTSSANANIQIGTASDMTYGTSSVSNNMYSVLDGALRVDFTAAPTDKGRVIRFLMNRNADNSLTEIQATIADDGTASIDLSSYDKVHLNAIKINGGPATFSSIVVIDGTKYQEKTLESIAANATYDKSTATCAMSIGVQNNSGGVIYGDSNVPHLAYADISGYDKIYATGTPGKALRFIFNRTIQEGLVTEKTGTFDANGQMAIDLSDIKEYAHLHAIKVGWGNDATTVNSISLYSEAKTDEYINYYLTGANTKDETALSALNDPNACVIDTKLLSNGATTALASMNPNCLFITDNASKISSKNIVVESGMTYSSNKVELVDGHLFYSPADISVAQPSTYQRPMSATMKWATVVLPFATTMPEDVAAYVLKKVDGADNTMTFRKIKDETIPANTPFVYLRTTEGDINMEFVGGNIEATKKGYNIQPIAGLDDWYICQSFESKKITLANDAELCLYDVYAISNNKFTHATKTLTIKPFRAFFLRKKSSAAPAPASFSIAIDDDEEATDIASPAHQSDAHEVERYNAAGQRVNAQQRGISIVRMSDGTVHKVYKK